MLAWSCLLLTLTCAVERARPSLRGTLDLWNEAHQRELFGITAFVFGVLLTALQWSRVIGPAPREIARLVLYFDLKRQPLFSKSFLVAAKGYLKYFVLHFSNWMRAKNQHAALSPE